MTLSEIFEHKPKFACRKVGNEMVLEPLAPSIATMNEMVTMNEVAAFIWDCIDGRNNEAVILTSVMEAFEINYETAKADYDSFIAQLSEII